VRELPVAGAVTDGIDVRNARLSPLIGADPLALVELHADRLEPEAFDGWTAPHGDEHAVCLHRLAVAVVHRELRAVVFHLRALLAELQRDVPLLELLRKLFRGVSILLRNERVEHLDDRDLRAEAAEDRRELATDDAAAEDDEALRLLLLCE